MDAAEVRMQRGYECGGGGKPYTSLSLAKYAELCKHPLRRTASPTGAARDKRLGPGKARPEWRI